MEDSETRNNSNPNLYPNFRVVWHGILQEDVWISCYGFLASWIPNSKLWILGVLDT
jgi:hypothetical protein